MTLIWPLLIFERVPTSRTGVFPVVIFSCKGPLLGRVSPYFFVSPRISHEHKRRKSSTNFIGNHFISRIDSPKVEIPSISLGKMCNCNIHGESNAMVIVVRRMVVHWHIESQKESELLFELNKTLLSTCRISKPC